MVKSQKESVSVSLPSETVQWVREMARKLGVSEGEVLRRVIDIGLQNWQMPSDSELLRRMAEQIGRIQRGEVSEDKEPLVENIEQAQKAKKEGKEKLPLWKQLNLPKPPHVIAAEVLGVKEQE